VDKEYIDQRISELVAKPRASCNRSSSRSIARSRGREHAHVTGPLPDSANGHPGFRAYLHPDRDSHPHSYAVSDGYLDVNPDEISSSLNSRSMIMGP
jgi:hypothetical protein